MNPDKRIRILFMGRKRVAVECLKFIAAMPDAVVAGVLTDSHLENSAVAQVAHGLGIKLYSHKEALVAMAQGGLQYDLGVSVLYWRKLQGDFLTMPQLGTINFHPAPLPEYKGTCGYNLAILDALPEWGVTAHYVDSAIDTGQIIEVARFPIDPQHETVAKLELQCARHLALLFQRVVGETVAKRAILESYPNIGGRYVSRDEMEAMKELKPGDDVARKVRAFWYPPYDGAFMVIDGRKYTLVDREILAGLADYSTTSLFAPRVSSAHESSSP